MKPSDNKPSAWPPPPEPPDIPEKWRALYIEADQEAASLHERNVVLTALLAEAHPIIKELYQGLDYWTYGKNTVYADDLKAAKEWLENAELHNVPREWEAKPPEHRCAHCGRKNPTIKVGYDDRICTKCADKLMHTTDMRIWTAIETCLIGILIGATILMIVALLGSR